MRREGRVGEGSKGEKGGEGGRGGRVSREEGRGRLQFKIRTDRLVHVQCFTKRFTDINPCVQFRY